jgi:hypothetical protein
MQKPGISTDKKTRNCFSLFCSLVGQTFRDLARLKCREILTVPSSAHRIFVGSFPYPISPWTRASAASRRRSHRSRATKGKMQTSDQRFRVGPRAHLAIWRANKLNFTHFHHTRHFVMSINVVARRQFRRFIASHLWILRLHEHLLTCDMAVQSIAKARAARAFEVADARVGILVGYGNSGAISDVEWSMNCRKKKERRGN